jgi:DNA repair exonuclease SbcCD ATPase subunit
MNHQFSADEIKQAARAARIYCQGFDEQHFESLMELARRVEQSGYLETVQGIHRIETERGITQNRLLDTAGELSGEVETLERQVAEAELRLNKLEELNSQASQKLGQLQEAIQKTEEALAGTTARCEKKARELKAFQNKADKEKRRIDKEVEDAHQRAGVTREEVAAATQIKAEVEKHGFTLELVLGLAGEFAGHSDAAEKLAAGLKQHGSLTVYLKNLKEEAAKIRQELMSEISRLELQNRQLEDSRLNLEAVVSQLKADEAVEQDIRHFHRRFGVLGPFLEKLSEWKGIYPLRCNHPVYAFTKFFNPATGCAHVWTDKPVSNKCPYCGLNTLVYDEEVYKAFNIPVGLPIIINLGE